MFICPSVRRSVVRQRGAPSSRPLKVGLRDERASRAKGKRSRGRGQQAQEEEKKRKASGRKEATLKTGKEGRKEGGRGERLKGREGKGSAADGVSLIPILSDFHLALQGCTRFLTLGPVPANLLPLVSRPYAVVLSRCRFYLTMIMPGTTSLCNDDYELHLRRGGGAAFITPLGPCSL